MATNRMAKNPHCPTCGEMMGSIDEIFRCIACGNLGCPLCLTNCRGCWSPLCNTHPIRDTAHIHVGRYCPTCFNKMPGYVS